MPKVNYLKPKERQSEPVDWLWAAVLERKTRYGMDLKEMAKIGGVTYETMRRLIRESPWAWGEDTRNKICAALDLRPVRSVEFVPPRGWEDTWQSME